MIRVLQVVNNMQRAGLETILMNYYRHIDRDEVQFDFLTHREGRSAYDDEIESLGGYIYRMPRLYPQNYPAYFKAMRIFFAAHPEYKIVHSHIDAMSALPLMAAKRAGVPIRIAHSHNTGIDRDAKLPLKYFFRAVLPLQANHYFACGTEAGQFLFGKRPFSVIKNAIDVAQFRFDAAQRAQVRQAMGVSDETLVIGCIGRLSYQKNHRFLLNVMAQVVAKRPTVQLWLIGEGEDHQALAEQIKALGLSQHVKMLGTRSDTAALYQGMDLFVLPSHFEGIPVVGVEAQAAGLPCLFSDAVADEVIYTKKVIKLPLTITEWVSRIVQQKPSQNRTVNDFGGYDIQAAQVTLIHQYRTLMAALG